MAVSLLLASACNGSWRPGGADARDLAVPMILDDAAAAAHADAPHVQPREAASGHHENDASPDRPDASPDLHEVAIDVSEAGAEDAAEAGSDVAP
jgi:hypothetical protein